MGRLFSFVSELSFLIFFFNLSILSCRRIVRSTGNLDFADSRWTQHAATANVTSRKLQPLSPLTHLVKNLPGLAESEKIVHYAGHLTVDEEKGGNLFYWLIEAQNVDPRTG
jgi:Serine carboxypeptidase